MLGRIPHIWYVCFAPLLLFTVLGAKAAATRAPVADDLPNFEKIDDHLYRGAQPTEAGIEKLKDLKIRTVVDLRPDRDQVAKERQWVEKAGMNFVNIPLNGWFRPKETDIERILGIIEDPQNQPVFIHCRRGADRTGTVAAVYRITDYGWTAEQAIREAKQHKFGWWQFWMKDFIKDYDRHHRQAKVNAVSLRTKNGVVPGGSGTSVPLNATSADVGSTPARRDGVSITRLAFELPGYFAFAESS